MVSGEESAQSAGLLYVSDASAGIRREGEPGAFRYRVSGRLVRDRATLQRIASLVVPPAWTDVWICPRPDGHLQATGRDARGRKQYRYHPRFRATRDEAKYERLHEFGARLPALRRRVERDLAAPGLARERVLALVVRLLERTLIRVGNEEYASKNGSFGLTTLQAKHARVQGERITLRFVGKSGKLHEIDIRDGRLARLVRRCQDLPGQELFQYETPEGLQSLGSGEINEYVREATGADFTAKDFRTWAGTLLAAQALALLRPPESAAEAKREVAAVIKAVSQELRNTPAVCRACYVHPEVLALYECGDLARAFSRPAARKRGLSANEVRLVSLLRPRRSARAAAA